MLDTKLHLRKQKTNDISFYQLLLITVQSIKYGLKSYINDNDICFSYLNSNIEFFEGYINKTKKITFGLSIDKCLYMSTADIVVRPVYLLWLVLYWDNRRKKKKRELNIEFSFNIKNAVNMNFSLLKLWFNDVLVIKRCQTAY